MYRRFNAMYACQTHISNPLMPYVTPFFPSLITVVLKFFRQSTTIPPSNYLLSKLITPASKILDVGFGLGAVQKRRHQSGGNALAQLIY